MNDPNRRVIGTQLGRRKNREQTEKTWAADAERKAQEPPPGEGRIVRESNEEQKVATVKPPQKHVDGEGKEVVPYRQINNADPAAPVMHGEGTTLEAPTAPAHQVGAPPPKQGAHHPVGHADPRTTPQSQPQTPVYRISASTPTNPSGARMTDPQHGFQTMQQQHGDGVQKVGGKSVQPVAVAGQQAVQTVPSMAIGMPASVHSVPGTVNPEQAAQLLAQQSGRAGAPQSQFQGGSTGFGATVGPGAQQQPQAQQGQFHVPPGQQPQPGQPGQPNQQPPGMGEILQESQIATIGLADDATMRAEVEAAGQSKRLQNSTTIKRRVPTEDLVPAERLPVTVILTCFGRTQLLRTQLDALRRGPKIPEMVVVLLVGDGPHPADVLSDGRPWVQDGPLPQNTYKVGASPWTRFQVALDVATEYVCILDDDCIPGENWLEECVTVHQRGLNAVIAAAGHRMSEDGSVYGYRGPWHGQDEKVAVSDVSGDTDHAALVDAGALGWFLRTDWMPTVAQVGPAGHSPYGWQLHVSAALQLEEGIPTVVLPYSTADMSAWGGQTPPERDGLSTVEGMGSTRADIFAAFREIKEDDGSASWRLVSELDDDARSVPMPEAPPPAPVERVDATAQPENQVDPKPQVAPEDLPPGAYWSAKLKRYVHYGEPEWSGDVYETLTGETFAPAQVAERVTETLQSATPDPEPKTAPGMLARSTRPQVGDADAPEAEAEAPVPAVGGVAPAIVELDAGKHTWCACGQSKTQPLCDGTHEDTPFEPLIFELEEKKKVFLCTCKATKKPPYCDGSHAKVAATQKKDAEAAAAADSADGASEASAE